MSNKAKIIVTAQDQASGVLNNIKNQLGSIGTAAKGMVALFAFDKIKEFFTKMVEIGGASSASMKASVTSIQDGLTGYMVTLAETVLGNEELMQAIKDVISAIFPLVNVLLKGLVPILTATIKVVMTLWNALRPLAELLLGVLLPAWEKLIMVAQQVANSFLIIKNAITGNFSEVKRLREENERLSQSMARSPWYRKVDLTPGDFAKAEGVGAKIRLSMEKGAEKQGEKSTVFKELLPKRSFDIVNTTTMKPVEPAALKSSMVKIPEAVKEVQDRFREEQQAWYEKQKANAAMFVDEFGGIVADGFARVFSGDLLGGIRSFFGGVIGSIGDGFRTMTMEWMKKQNVFIVFQAKIYAFYGKLMAGLAKLLGNPFTAGLAALGIAAGLSALSRSLGGGGGGGAAGVSNFAGGFTSGATQQSVVDAGSARGNITINFPDGLVDMSNPTTQRQFTKLINEVAGNRGLNFAGA